MATMLCGGPPCCVAAPHSADKTPLWRLRVWAGRTDECSLPPAEHLVRAGW
jgi:hypothetical protein